MMNVGGVTVNVTQPNASPEMIYRKTLDAVKDATNKATARRMRDVKGNN